MGREGPGLFAALACNGHPFSMRLPASLAFVPAQGDRSEMAADGDATNGHAMNGDDKATIVKGQAAGDSTFEVRAMSTGVWARDQDLEGAVTEQRAKASPHGLQPSTDSESKCRGLACSFSPRFVDGRVLSHMHKLRLLLAQSMLPYSKEVTSTRFAVTSTLALRAVITRHNEFLHQSA